MRIATLVLAVVATLLLALRGTTAETPTPVVEAEEDVYSYRPADNGAGPMWCHGNTSIVRSGDELLASGIETIAGAAPLNNCLPMLFHRGPDGWEMVYKGVGRTREPSPMATLNGGRVFLSVNPTLTEADAHGGPAQPRLLEFAATSPLSAPETHLPVWDGQPPFTEHSYRSFAADGSNSELILFQNVGYTHVEWAFLDRDGSWSAQGKLPWPFGDRYDRPQPIRVCYPAVALKDRQVHFCGVSDIIEPYDAWRDYKHELTGRKWDYDFRRLFYCWSDDIRTGRFHDWVEVASRDRTCGWITPKDMYVAPNGDVFVLWAERALDERLRERFFPDEKQRHALEYAVIRGGVVALRGTLLEGGDDSGGARPGDAVFHVTDDGRLFAFYGIGGTDAKGAPLTGYRLVEIFGDGKHGEPVAIHLETPLGSFFTATVRAGNRPSRVLDLFGDAGGTMRYARIRLW